MSDRNELLNQKAAISQNIVVLEKKYTRKQNAFERFGQGSLKQLSKIQDRLNILRDQEADVNYSLRTTA